MKIEEYKELYKLINKYKEEIDPDLYSIKNDLEFVIISIRNNALEKYNIVMESK